MNIQQAIDEGYEYCQEVGNEGKLIHLSDVMAEPGNYANSQLLLCEKEPRFNSMDADELEMLIIEHLDNQEEFYTEDGFSDATDGCEDLIKQLSEKITDNLRKRPFWFATKTYLKY